MDRDPLDRIDSFPYRHRVQEVMARPPLTAPHGIALAEAARCMHQNGASALLVVDAAGRPAGILTEHDLLAAIADAGATVLGRPVESVMSSPVTSLPPDAYVFTAIARMDRLGIRHLAVVDPASGRPLGVVGARDLLRQRAGQALMLGDEIAAAQSGPAMAGIQARLPALAAVLREDKVGGLEIAGVISAILRDISARAAVLAAEGMERDGQGPAPAPWCYLVLGSGGRGESLLAADQDNAIVHAGRVDDDGWFAELGRRASDLLNASGIPFCRGGVMAMNGAWRDSLDGWRRRIGGWVAKAEGEGLLNTDIFFDFQPVHGDHRLAQTLRAQALATARAPLFLFELARDLSRHRPPLGLFGRFVGRQGRVDLKRGGLFPLVAGARILALRQGIAATGTAARLNAAAAAGLIAAEDLAAFADAHELLVGLILDQQIADIADGLPPSSGVEVRRLTGVARRHLREALRRLGEIDWMVRDALSA